jgi:hypothetical protein
MCHLQIIKEHVNVWRLVASVNIQISAGCDWEVGKCRDVGSVSKYLVLEGRAKILMNRGLLRPLFFAGRAIIVNNAEIDRYKRAFAVPRVSKYLVICDVKTVRKYVRRQGSSEMGCKSSIVKSVKSISKNFINIRHVRTMWMLWLAICFAKALE